jgi:hypothetical protein
MDISRSSVESDAMRFVAMAASGEPGGDVLGPLADLVAAVVALHEDGRRIGDIVAAVSADGWAARRRADDDSVADCAAFARFVGERLDSTAGETVGTEDAIERALLEAAGFQSMADVVASNDVIMRSLAALPFDADDETGCAAGAAAGFSPFPNKTGRLDFTDMKRQAPGEMRIQFKDEVVRARSFVSGDVGACTDLAAAGHGRDATGASLRCSESPSLAVIRRSLAALDFDEPSKPRMARGPSDPFRPMAETRVAQNGVILRSLDGSALQATAVDAAIGRVLAKEDGSGEGREGDGLVSAFLESLLTED